MLSVSRRILKIQRKGNLELIRGQVFRNMKAEKVKKNSYPHPMYLIKEFLNRLVCANVLFQTLE